MRANAEAGTSTSIAADTVAPSRMNGIASTSSDPNTMSRLRSHGRLEGSATRTSTATPASVASTQATGGPERSRRRGRRAGARGSTSTAISSTSRRRRRTTGTRRRRAGTSPAPRSARSASATCWAVSERSTSTSRSRKSPSAAVAADDGGADRGVDGRRERPMRRAPRVRRSDPVPAITNVASGTTARTASTTSAVAESTSRTRPSSTMPSTSVMSSSPKPPEVTMVCSAAPARRGSATRVTRSRSSLSRYQPSPMMPRSAGSVSTAPTAACCPLAASRSSANVAITEPAPGADQARRTAPSSSRTSVPVMPWAEGSPPVPIVVSVAAGSSGSDPVTASMVPAPWRIARRRNGHAPGLASRSGVPTPFHAMTHDEGRGRCPSVITPGIASPVRTSGWGRRTPATASSVGAIASRRTPSGNAPGVTPAPRNTMGTRVSVAVAAACARPARQPARGRRTRWRPCRRRRWRPSRRGNDPRGTRPRSLDAATRATGRTAPPPALRCSPHRSCCRRRTPGARRRALRRAPARAARSRADGRWARLHATATSPAPRPPRLRHRLSTTARLSRPRRSCSLMPTCPSVEPSCPSCRSPCSS